MRLSNGRRTTNRDKVSGIKQPLAAGQKTNKQTNKTTKGIFNYYSRIQTLGYTSQASLPTISVNIPLAQAVKRASTKAAGQKNMFFLQKKMLQSYWAM